MRLWRPLLKLGAGGKLHLEGRTLTDGQLDPNAAAVHFDDFLAMTRPRPVPPFASGVGAVDLVELLEDPVLTGSGRWGSRRPLADAFQRIDLAQIRREHPMTADATAVVMSCCRNGVWERTTLQLTATPMRFGGKRFWFRCPYCFGRCRVLYASSRRTSCWRCQRLRYRTQLETMNARALRGMQKIARRLDPEADDIWLPPKPPHMHWSTYNRLVDKYNDYDAKWARALRRFGIRF
jgi:hypothetical protein